MKCFCISTQINENEILKFIDMNNYMNIGPESNISYLDVTFKNYAHCSIQNYNRGASQAQHDTIAARWNVKGDQKTLWVSVDTVFCWTQ